MTDFPERIHAMPVVWLDPEIKTDGHFSPKYEGSEFASEYVRADLYGELERENARLRDGLDAAHQYGSDTMVGPGGLGNITLADWYKSGVKEMTERLKRVIDGGYWHSKGGE